MSSELWELDPQAGSLLAGLAIAVSFSSGLLSKLGVWHIVDLFRTAKLELFPSSFAWCRNWSTRLVCSSCLAPEP